MKFKESECTAAVEKTKSIDQELARKVRKTLEDVKDSIVAILVKIDFTDAIQAQKNLASELLGTLQTNTNKDFKVPDANKISLSLIQHLSMEVYEAIDRSNVPLPSN